MSEHGILKKCARMYMVIRNGVKVMLFGLGAPRIFDQDCRMNSKCDWLICGHVDFDKWNFVSRCTTLQKLLPAPPPLIGYVN
jgi:hypothetical protein